MERNNVKARASRRVYVIASVAVPVIFCALSVVGASIVSVSPGLGYTSGLKVVASLQFAVSIMFAVAVVALSIVKVVKKADFGSFPAACGAAVGSGIYFAVGIMTMNQLKGTPALMLFVPAVAVLVALLVVALCMRVIVKDEKARAEQRNRIKAANSETFVNLMIDYYLYDPSGKYARKLFMAAENKKSDFRAKNIMVKRVLSISSIVIAALAITLFIFIAVRIRVVSSFKMWPTAVAAPVLAIVLGVLVYSCVTGRRTYDIVAFCTGFFVYFSFIALTPAFATHMSLRGELLIAAVKETSGAVMGFTFTMLFTSMLVASVVMRAMLYRDFSKLAR